MNDIMKIVQALEYSNIFFERNYENKEQEGAFLGMLLGTLGASSLGNMLTRKGMLRAGYGSSIKKKVNLTPSFNKL